MFIWGGTKIRRHSRDQLALAANTDGTTDGTAGALLAIIRRLAMQLLYRDGTHTHGTVANLREFYGADPE